MFKMHELGHTGQQGAKALVAGWTTHLLGYCLVVHLGVHLPDLVEGEVRDGCGIEAKYDLLFRHNRYGLHNLAVHTLAREV